MQEDEGYEQGARFRSFFTSQRSEVYDEDDFTNLINGYQYTIDELKSVCKHLYEASVQYKFI